MKENWFLIGDLHGDSGPVAYFYNRCRERLELDNCHNSMIILGDAGLNGGTDDVVDMLKFMEMSRSDSLKDIMTI